LALGSCLVPHPGWSQGTCLEAVLIGQTLSCVVVIHAGRQGVSQYRDH
jgi:hypothetical protein